MNARFRISAAELSHPIVPPYSSTLPRRSVIKPKPLAFRRTDFHNSKVCHIGPLWEKNKNLYWPLSAIARRVFPAYMHFGLHASSLASFCPIGRIFYSSMRSMEATVVSPGVHTGIEDSGDREQINAEFVACKAHLLVLTFVRGG